MHAMPFKPFRPAAAPKRSRGFSIVEMVSVMMIISSLGMSTAAHFFDVAAEARAVATFTATNGNALAAMLGRQATSNYFMSVGRMPLAGKWIYTCMQGQRLYYLAGDEDPGPDNKVALGGGYYLTGDNSGLFVWDEDSVEVKRFTLGVSNGPVADPWDAANQVSTGQTRNCTMTDAATSETFTYTIWGCSNNCATGF